jgi:hypothetical protein
LSGGTVIAHGIGSMAWPAFRTLRNESLGSDGHLNLSDRFRHDGGFLSGSDRIGDSARGPDHSEFGILPSEGEMVE